ncbi:hydrogenase expression/formation protein HypE [Allokutzneria oryzae]|uniref:Hydrogenase expression/formation protein HypE n=1 Tax=Allokutzneria oryzae TaxID=1378989 RepID=A0ABV5ZT05_9PSEU
MSMDSLAATRPRSLAETERLLRGHGSGGHLIAELLAEVFTRSPGTGRQPGADLVFSTETFVVSPRFFPGGDIGSLSVFGTVNAVAVRGARPVALAVAYVVEEGLPLAELRAVTESVAAAARAAGVAVVAGDTKVVGRGRADGIYLTVTGVGLPLPGARTSPAAGRRGDVVLLSGPIGRHGTAVLAAREGLGPGLEAGIRSDSRPLHGLVATMIEKGGGAVHALRAPTRGGLASALNELAAASGVAIEITEPDLPVPCQVAEVCELLGLDPLQIANEGCLVALVAPVASGTVLGAMRCQAEGVLAQAIGVVTDGPPGRVTARTSVGATRVVDALIGVGEQPATPRAAVALGERGRGGSRV